MSSRSSTVTASADRLDHAVAAFLLKILMSAFFVRDRPGPGQPSQEQKAIDSRAQPGEPNVWAITLFGSAANFVTG